ncbi:hypothetical protein [Nocardia grenadensis]|uniref:hypothetical protein n=1 Tax=Nocardia grenadensis TaxID=931537 RepID=UPI000B0CD89B
MEHRIVSGRLARAGMLGKLAATQAAHGVGTKMALIGRTDQARRMLAERSTLQAAQQMVAVLGSMKGTAMKLGQMLSRWQLQSALAARTFRFDSGSVAHDS